MDRMRFLWTEYSLSLGLTRIWTNSSLRLLLFLDLACTGLVDAIFLTRRLDVPSLKRLCLKSRRLRYFTADG